MSQPFSHALEGKIRLAGYQWSRSAKDRVLWKELETTLTL